MYLSLGWHSAVAQEETVLQALPRLGDMTVPELDAWIENGLSVDAVLPDSNPLIVAAGLLENHALVEALLKRGADPLQKNDDGLAIWSVAVLQQDTGLLGILSEQGVFRNPHQSFGESNPLFLAIQENWLTGVEVILAGGAQIQREFGDTQSALAFAKEQDTTNIYALLLETDATQTPLCGVLEFADLFMSSGGWCIYETTGIATEVFAERCREICLRLTFFPMQAANTSEASSQKTSGFSVGFEASINNKWHQSAQNAMPPVDTVRIHFSNICGQVSILRETFVERLDGEYFATFFRGQTSLEEMEIGKLAPFTSVDPAVSPIGCFAEETDLVVLYPLEDGRVVSDRLIADGITTSIVSIFERLSSKSSKRNREHPGWLGVQIQDLTGDIATSINLASNHGAIVTSLIEEGPAFQAGLTVGDVIMSLAGEVVADTEDLVSILQRARAGKTIRVEVWRNGETRTLAVKLGSRDSNAADSLDLAPEGKEPRRKDTLGLSLSEITNELRQSLNLGEVTSGLVIEEVDEASEAYEKGLRAGDVISEAGQRRVASISGLETQIGEARQQGHQALLLLIRRGNDPRFVALSLN